MAVKAMGLVGLDVHARQTHAAVLDPGERRVDACSELRVSRWRWCGFLEGLGGVVRAVYEAGPTGFGLARAARASVGSRCGWSRRGRSRRAPGDRVKTDRRDAIRLVRLLAAGELSFAFVPSVEDERFRDLVRASRTSAGI